MIYYFNRKKLVVRISNSRVIIFYVEYRDDSLIIIYTIGYLKSCEFNITDVSITYISKILFVECGDQLFIEGLDRFKWFVSTHIVYIVVAY